MSGTHTQSAAWETCVPPETGLQSGFGYIMLHDAWHKRTYASREALRLFWS